MITRRSVVIGASLWLASCKDDDKPPTPPPVVPNRLGRIELSPDEWTIGPIINGQSYSPGMPRHPSAEPGAAWAVTFPGKDGLHAVTTNPSGRLDGRITARYRVEGEAKPVQGSVATVSLFFQRSGDDWSGVGAMAGYRWYHPIRAMIAGEQSVEVALQSDQWTNVFGQHDNGDFSDAKKRPVAFGFVFGDPSVGATAHGITGNGRFVLLDCSMVAS